MTEDALQLLQAARDVHAGRRDGETFALGAELDLVEAAERVGTYGGSLLYEACVAELENEGAIAPSPVARGARGTRGAAQYIVTQRGLKLLQGT